VRIAGLGLAKSRAGLREHARVQIIIASSFVFLGRTHVQLIRCEASFQQSIVPRQNRRGALQRCRGLCVVPHGLVDHSQVVLQLIVQVRPVSQNGRPKAALQHGTGVVELAAVAQQLTVKAAHLGMVRL